MKDIFLSKLRDKQTKSAQFREYANKLAYALAAEVATCLDREHYVLDTPIEKMEGQRLKNNIVLIPILRSGIALLNPFLDFFREAHVGFIGLRRDEKTAIAELYYHKLPAIAPTDDVIMLDPMIATGGSAIAALRILTEAGIKPQKIVFAAVVAAPEGVEAIQEAFPAITIVGPVVDRCLNDSKFIVPGLGDFGDRYFGTIEKYEKAE